MVGEDREAVVEPALEAVGVSHRYRREGPPALEDLDVAVPQGAIAALIGPNGAGKSTLIRSWIGFERPERGSLRVMGVDVLRDGRGALLNVGYLSQSVGLYRGLTVDDHVELGRTLRPRFDGEDATGLLERMRIPLDRRAGELSGGQQAQVALALALGTRAPVYLLDEPLASLDPLARGEFLAILLDEVRSRAVTVLLASHIVSDVEHVCDWLVVLGAGRVVLQGPTKTALASHRVDSDGSAAVDDIGTFRRPGGPPLRLRRSDDPRLPTPTLEDLVMGYLASARPPAAGHEGAVAV